MYLSMIYKILKCQKVKQLKIQSRTIPLFYTSQIYKKGFKIQQVNNKVINYQNHLIGKYSQMQQKKKIKVNQQPDKKIQKQKQIKKTLIPSQQSFPKHVNVQQSKQSTQTKKNKTNQHQQIPLTQQQIKIQTEKQQALHRLSKLQQISQQTINKKSTILLGSITKSIQKDIMSSLLQIAQQPQQITRFLVKKKQKQKEEIQSQGNTDALIQKQHQNLIDRRQKMRQQLKELQQKQMQLKKSLSNSKIFSSPNHRHNKMPQLSQQVKQHWLKIRQIVKQHEQQSKRMQQINFKKLKQQRQQQLELQQRKNRERSQQKKKVLELKIQQIRKRHIERTTHIKEQQAIIERLQNKKKLFQKMQQNWQNFEKQQKVKHEALMLERYLHNRQVNMRQLKQYQKQHDDRYQEEQQKRKRKVSESKVSGSISTFHKTKFLTDVLEEEKKNKVLEQEKISQIKQLMDKRKQYASTLKQKFKSLSRLDKKMETKNQEPRTLKDTRSMSAFDIKNKGNQYMRTINSSVSKLKQKVKQKTQQKESFHQSVKEYKNYLKQLRVNRTAYNQSSNSNRDLDMIDSIMKKPNASTQQKFYQAQLITKKMESKGTSKNLLNSINAKMQILKKLSYQDL